ncbi:PREDICTED: potassium/sodium hyperpolarization-activated cyclic nucleotide-gated channel 1-like, partial [Cyphomyrmex costatus]|uniref:potassium/sodium hyperpolarization-activated cyclic nucleotide-gated channel 1-like n=1 Tax=Cyphomyrmex costatus TaxID=456900 RepID=UPI000852412B
DLSGPSGIQGVPVTLYKTISPLSLMLQQQSNYLLRKQQQQQPQELQQQQQQQPQELQQQQQQQQPRAKLHEAKLHEPSEKSTDTELREVPTTPENMKQRINAACATISPNITSNTFDVRIFTPINSSHYTVHKSIKFIEAVDAPEAFGTCGGQLQASTNSEIEEEMVE